MCAASARNISPVTILLSSDATTPSYHRSQPSLQVRSVDPLATFVEANLPAAYQGFLQPSTNLDGLDCALKLQRNRCVVQASLRELVRLLDEGRFESTPVVSRALSPNQFASLRSENGLSYLFRDPAR